VGIEHPVLASHVGSLGRVRIPVEDSNPPRLHYDGIVKALLGTDPAFELCENKNATKTEA